jgi:xanthine dehydrogenase small subunit
VIISFFLNGESISVETSATRRVVDLLREDLGLTGTKEACGAGECGGCTILVDGEARLSCLMAASQLEGREVVTIEGLAAGEVLHPIQQAFVDHGAIQCGFCTPGMVLSAVDLLRRKRMPTRQEIRNGISGNLCRCTGYQKIVDAVEAASLQLKEDSLRLPEAVKERLISGPIVRPRQDVRAGRPVYSPRTLDELWTVLVDEPEAVLVAGGTDVLPKARRENGGAGPLVFVGGVRELTEVRIEDEMLFIGAAAGLRRIAEHPLIRADFPVLAEAIGWIGAPAIRTMGTLGGNICTASPAGDTLPPLYVLSAFVETRSANGFRVVPIERFILGPGRTALDKGEILYGVWVRKERAPSIHHFEKVGQRRAQAISVASMAALVGLSGNGTIQAIRLAWGSVAPTVIRIPEVEAFLTGKPLLPEVLKAALPIVRSRVSPIDDVRASASYRRTVAANLLMRLAGYAADE